MIERGGKVVGWEGRGGPRRKDSVEISCLRDAFVLTLDVERPEGQTGWRDALHRVSRSSTGTTEAVPCVALHRVPFELG